MKGGQAASSKGLNSANRDAIVSEVLSAQPTIQKRHRTLTWHRSGSKPKNGSPHHFSVITLVAYPRPYTGNKRPFDVADFLHKCLEEPMIEVIRVTLDSYSLRTPNPCTGSVGR